MTGFEIILTVLLVATVAGGIAACRKIDHGWAKLAAKDIETLKGFHAGELDRAKTQRIEGYTNNKLEAMTRQASDAEKDLEAAQEKLRIAIEARDHWQNNFRQADDLREAACKALSAEMLKFSPEQIACLEAIGFIVTTTAQEWTAPDAKWLRNAFGSGHGFKFRELVKNVSNNYMIHAVSNPPEGTREWRAGVAMGFRSLVTLLEIYEQDENFVDPNPALTELAKDRQPPAPNGTTVAADRARFTP